MTNVEPLVTNVEVAEYLRKPKSWVYVNAERLNIPRLKVGKQYRYRISEIAEWLEGNRSA